MTIPYSENFEKGGRHPGYYFGASLKNLCRLSTRTGYNFVSRKISGVNAFFTHRDGMTTPAPRDERGPFVPVYAERVRPKLLRLTLVTVHELGKTEEAG